MCLAAAAKLLTQLRLGHEALELRGERLRVAGLEQQPEIALAEHLLVDRETRGERDGAGGDPLLKQHRGRGDARGRRAQDVRTGEQRLERLAPWPRQAHAVTQRPGQPRGRVGGAGRPDRGAPGQLQRHATQTAQEEAQGRALLLGDEHDVHAVAFARPGPEAIEIDAGGHHVVLAGEEARDQAPGDLERGEARVEAPEEELDEPSCDLRGEHALRGRVKAADVQRARVAQRGGRRARRERLVHVHDVEWGALQQRVDHAARVERQRDAAPAARRGGDRLHRGEHPHLAGREQGGGLRRGRPHEAPRLADLGPRRTRRQHQHAVTAPRRGRWTGGPRTR